MKNKNQLVADKLNAMDLRPETREIINNTDLQIMAELFGGLETAEDVERFVEDVFGGDLDG